MRSELRSTIFTNSVLLIICHTPVDAMFLSTGKIASRHVLECFAPVALTWAVKNSVFTSVLGCASFDALFSPRASLPGTSERFSIRAVNKLGFAPVGLPDRNGRISPVKLGYLPGKLVRGAVRWTTIC